MYKAVEIVKDIYWVGVIDWNERNFHGYTTDRGSTYNAYLIMDEKITLIDTCKRGFTEEMLERISQVVDPRKSISSSATMWSRTIRAAFPPCMRWRPAPPSTPAPPRV